MRKSERRTRSEEKSMRAGLAFAFSTTEWNIDTALRKCSLSKATTEHAPECFGDQMIVIFYFAATSL